MIFPQCEQRIQPCISSLTEIVTVPDPRHSSRITRGFMT
jgi:hypothetical protein